MTTWYETGRLDKYNNQELEFRLPGGTLVTSNAGYYMVTFPDGEVVFARQEFTADYPGWTPTTVLCPWWDVWTIFRTKNAINEAVWWERNHRDTKEDHLAEAEDIFLY